jgi:DNA-binding protein HU-beta
MTKSELVAKMAKDAAISKRAAADALESLMAAVCQSVKKKKGKLCITGFGTFYKQRSKARKYRHPQTGKLRKVKAHNVVRFRPGLRLRAIR